MFPFRVSHSVAPMMMPTWHFVANKLCCMLFHTHTVTRMPVERPRPTDDDCCCCFFLWEWFSKQANAAPIHLASFYQGRGRGRGRKGELPSASVHLPTCHGITRPKSNETKNATNEHTSSRGWVGVFCTKTWFARCS